MEVAGAILVMRGVQVMVSFEIIWASFGLLNVVFDVVAACQLGAVFGQRGIAVRTTATPVLVRSFTTIAIVFLAADIIHSASINYTFLAMSTAIIYLIAGVSVITTAIDIFSHLEILKAY